MQTKSNCHQEQRFETADIFRLYGDRYRSQNRLSKEQLKAMRHIADCRTASMGGHKKKIRGTPYLFIVDYKLQLSYERLWQE